MGTTLSASVQVPTLGCVPVPGSRTESLNSSPVSVFPRGYMKIPENAIIPEPKLTKYLLVCKARNDKSKYLSQGGFFLHNWQLLKLAIVKLIQENEALEDITDEYGTYYQVMGELQGINNNNLPVVTIWLKRTSNNEFQFITLKPYRT